MDVSKELLGAWKLIYSRSVADDGSEVYPYGQDAIGYICYDNSGIMSVQISRRVHGSEPGKSDYLAYFGRYEVDISRQVIKHVLEGQLFAHQHKEIEERKYDITGKLLSLRPVQNLNHEILWEKV